MYSVDRNGADRYDRGSLKIPVDKKEKGQRAGGFYLIFCPRTVSTFAKPRKADPLAKALQKSLLPRPQDTTTLKIAFV